MTTPATAGDFLRLATGSSDPEPDEFRNWCDTCRRQTLWKLTVNILRQQIYRCVSCGRPAGYRVGP